MNHKAVVINMDLSRNLQLFILFLPSIIIPISMLSTNVTIKQNLENLEEPVIHITEYSTAIINISWVDPNGKVLHTDTSETGRFSSAGPATVSGILALAKPQVLYNI